MVNENEIDYDAYDIPYDGKKRPTKYIGDEIEEDDDDRRED